MPTLHIKFICMVLLCSTILTQLFWFRNASTILTSCPPQNRTLRDIIQHKKRIEQSRNAKNCVIVLLYMGQLTTGKYYFDRLFSFVQNVLVNFTFVSACCDSVFTSLPFAPLSLVVCKSILPT